jgi:DNA-binding beta-propeller fold protein YncE
MNDDRCDRWARTLTAPARHAAGEALLSSRLDALARMLSAAASRRRVLGGMLAALLAPWLPADRAAAGQEERCWGSDCPCPCPDPPCFLRAWGGGDFVVPGGVATATDGTVYVAEYPNRILRFDAAGTLLKAWGSEGSGKGQFINPSGAAVTPDGTVYVADAGNDRIQAFCVTP